ncbi:transmembrane protein 248-like [Tubulanus polymorphus]|uniref:transmembrane protein 248-like n=1 Tax=Tubulanus polymorphus TaxID=672921 RepID=UPI003DA2ADD0
MALTPVENVKGFVTSRPPLVLFMISISLFAIVLLTLSYIIKVNEIKDPNFAEDWNVFLESFSRLEFCVTGKDSEHNAPVVNSPPQVKENSAPDENDDGILTYETSRNYSVSLLLTVHPKTDFLRIRNNVTHLHGVVKGQQLGLKGAAAQEDVNITFSLPYNWNLTQCNEEGTCEPVKIYTCVHFQASPAVFPVSKYGRPQMCRGMNETGEYYHAHVEAHKDYSFFKYYRCRKQTKISVHYNINPALTVMLSLHDRSVINLHLMHTSYFLFVMVVTIFCYAVIRGRPSKVKYVQVQTEEI